MKRWELGERAGRARGGRERGVGGSEARKEGGRRVGRVGPEGEVDAISRDLAGEIWWSVSPMFGILDIRLLHYTHLSCLMKISNCVILSRVSTLYRPSDPPFPTPARATSSLP